MHRTRKETKNVEQNDNSLVETIVERLKRLCTNEIDGQNRLRLWEEEGGRAGKQRQLEGEKPMNNLKRKTPVKIIEERRQRLRTSRMDTRLRTPSLR